MNTTFNMVLSFDNCFTKYMTFLQEKNAFLQKKNLLHWFLGLFYSMIFSSCFLLFVLYIEFLMLRTKINICFDLENNNRQENAIQSTRNFVSSLKRFCINLFYFKVKTDVKKIFSGKKNEVSKHMDGFEHLRLNIT